MMGHGDDRVGEAVCAPGWRHDVPMKCPCYEDYDTPDEPWIPVRRMFRWLSRLVHSGGSGTSR